jgi:hypothetical protein
LSVDVSIFLSSYNFLRACSVLPQSVWIEGD